MNLKGIPIFEKIPDGWSVLDGATTAPKGYIFVWNKKSRFGGEYKNALVKDEKCQVQR